MDKETAESHYIESYNDDDNENSEDLLSSILGGDDNKQQIDPNRYQHQFTDYDSSDEEIEPLSDANSNAISIDATTNDDEVNDVDEGSNYLPLIDDEFGEYISITEFSSDNDLSLNGTNNHLNHTEVVVVVDDDLSTLQPNNKLYLPSIPPLSTDKIIQIKAIMAKVKLNPPSLSAASIADCFERQKVRIGDEIT